MVNNFATFVIVLTILHSKEALQRANKPFIMKRFECTGQPYTFITMLQCGLTGSRHGTQMATLVAELTRSIAKVYIKTDVYRKNRQTQTFVYGTTFEYCEFLMHNESRRSNPVAVLTYNYAKHNFPQVLLPCPVNGIINVTNLSLDENMIPPFVTPGGYSAAQRFYTKRNETLAQYEAEFIVGAPSIFNKTFSLFTFR